MSTIRPFALLASPSLDLSAIDDAERLFLWRHRQRTGLRKRRWKDGSVLTQAEAASRLGISLSAYSKLEHGRRPCLGASEAQAVSAALGPIRPTPAEMCLIARRRSGLGIVAVTSEMGVSRPHFYRLERDAATSVVEHWELRGYRFSTR